MVKTNPFSTSSFSAVGFPSRAGGLFGTGGSNPFSSGSGVSVKLASVGGQVCIHVTGLVIPSEICH